ncbi:NFX1-type zinc finger-containing protein 1 [Hypsizygus marmoreus]|uniref:NFX1-type zinc finger-containing protein 1 n=1 Tax=Hypsizygus marmoreus TaxID=39966 RepID=A0A369JN39_HYPMA|nr:NFX1-type zinc finger-containing protein 1 [Hypsizygus marmoreus]
MDSSRTTKLNKHLDAILYGRQQINPQNAALFIEAVCAQQDTPSCVTKIIASKSGLDAIQSAMRFTLTPAFFNGGATQLLSYLQVPTLKDVAGGSLLNEVVVKIVEPSIFWDPFRKSFATGSLEANGQLCFAWLLHYLVSLPSSVSSVYRDQAPLVLDALLASSNNGVRTFGQKIKHILETCSTGALVSGQDGPGGRHDNDFVDFRHISILPTSDEVTSTDPPFLRRSVALEDPSTESTRQATHLDNQFRLLREDMLYEMREELQIAFKKKKGYHRHFVINGLTVMALHCGPDNRRCKWGITLGCWDDFPQLKDVKDRKKALTENRNILRHQSLACLIADDDIVAFPTVNRDEDLLAKKPPVIVLQFEGEATTIKALLKLKTSQNIRLIQIDTAIFSYMPILKALQQTTTMPLSPELLLWKENSIMSQTEEHPTALVQALRTNPQHDIQGLLKTKKSIRLDRSQAASLISGLMQKVSLIQGPPGTGKSFIGTLIAKALHDFTTKTILVVCYTNHALDDILEGLLDIGIPQDSMVRLGGKSTSRTEPMMMQKQKSTFRRDKGGWALIDNLKVTSEVFREDLEKKFSRYIQSNILPRDILVHLEFEEPAYYEAFRVPQADDGSTRVGRKGKAVNKFYLFEQWNKGWDAGIFKNERHIKAASEIWSMPVLARREQIAKWMDAIFREQLDEIYAAATHYNGYQDKLARHWSEKDTEILKGKRIIGCTTTAAAKYSESIQAASPGVLLVEEAGEILESHVLTALGPETSQLVLIGDHKQLRPKVNNYKLTVEKDEGFDLNRSLFERLILKGYPHEKLTEQHRMRPEISALIRALTYPELVDATKTQNRPNLRGVQDNIVFVNHDHPEDNALQLKDRRDGDSTSSKHNTYEVEMVLKILRYLAQQGYGTDKVVILTPYLGQLQKLQAALKKDNDPILNDMDSFDLVRAGLLPAGTAKLTKRPIRLATIDNYQGEESDIVIVSLTRSNAQHDIGFMYSPERLNVLLSRARNALIMIGNARTFANSRKGGLLWGTLFELLRGGKHVYEGMPVQCEQHNDRKAILSKPGDFEDHCPDGGCMEPCGTMLNCGVHPCPSKCHQLYDHSKMPCLQIVRSQCSNGHQQSWKCHQNKPSTCAKCERAAKLAEEKRQKEYELQQKRDAEQLEHSRRMAALDEQIAQQEQSLMDSRSREEREAAFQQRGKDLEAAIARATEPQAPQTASSAPSKPSTAPSQQKPNAESQLAGSPGTPLETPKSPSTNEKLLPIAPSASQTEWQRQKDVEGATNDAIDAIMDMTGLEEVKEQVLIIKVTIDTKKRQGASFKQERFNIVLLGNPGTGKTTVARSYAKCLSSLKVLPGDAFIETTGSRLANEGVDGIKKLIEGVINAGGGAVFVDEAYQLTSKHNFQGGQVLDFLLAEMENNIGTIVFILAGYNKEMETFFEHNPGLQSRVPYKLHFSDYTDSELLTMLDKLVQKRFQGKMKVEDGVGGLYVRIAVRRLSRGRGREGFGNARALQNMLDEILRRQAKRLNEERRRGRFPDDFLLSQADLIGPDPSQAIKESAAWTKLQSLVGLQAVKDSVSSLISLIETNYQRELQEQKPVATSLNRVFLGSPGTGKTTVASLYGRILADLGLISNGEVLVKNPADFIGSVLGESETKTKAILANTVGKVLVIDEAYMLYGGGGDVGKSNDMYKTAVIDTMVAEVQSVPGEDRCVLLLGYKEQMEEMFQNVNPGLSRRFAIDNAFNFEDFSNSDLLKILNFKLKSQDLSASDAAKDVAIQVLDRARNRPNFGNAGEVENLLGQAKTRYQTRQKKELEKSFDIVFEPQDFDPDFDRDAHASTNLTKLFEDVVGCEEVVKKLGDYQQLARALKHRGVIDRDQIPTNFVFKGPPGTGKTTVARKMGQVYYDMGFLSSKEVVECSASDLVGQYVGHTGKKTQQLLEKALGRVLFIDEAYRLSEGHFAKEAIDELVSLLTQEKFKAKIIVILAGYDKDMNKLMAVNSGLASRFPEQIHFKNMEPSRCLEVLHRELAKKNVLLPGLEDPSSSIYIQMASLISELSGLPSWGNARDMITCARNMIKLAFLEAANQPVEASITLSGEDAVKCIETMLAEQRERCANVPKKFPSDFFGGMREPVRTADPPAPPITRTAQPQVAKAPPPPEVKVPEPTPTDPSDSRDPGVSDAVWNALQACKKAEEERIRKDREDAEKLRVDIQKQEEAARKQQIIAQELARREAKDDAERQELKRQREAARLAQLKALEERRRLAAVLEKKRRLEEERQKKEAKAQAALRQMGVCSAGFRWVNIGSGYRCTAGGHYVSNDQLGV